MGGIMNESKNMNQSKKKMSGKSTIVRHSLRQIEALRERGVDPTRADAPEAESLGADFWKSERVVMPTGKTSATPKSPVVPTSPHLL